jgi:hypothetical protein
MGKTRAEIQKAYRDRKKLSDPSFLEKERKRARKNRASARILTQRKLIVRREKNKTYCKKYRQKKRIEKDNSKASLQQIDDTPLSTEEESNTISGSSDITRSSATESSIMIVRLDFSKVEKQKEPKSQAYRRSWFEKVGLQMKVSAHVVENGEESPKGLKGNYITPQT